MEIVGKLSNNKIFCYKYFYENLESNFDNFLKVINTNDRTAISDYIDLLYKKMAPLTDAEREELNELRKRTRRLEMEIEATKKLNALVQARIERETQKKRK